jgi:hypothetical protein
VCQRTREGRAGWCAGEPASTATPPTARRSPTAIGFHQPDRGVAEQGDPDQPRNDHLRDEENRGDRRLDAADTAMNATGGAAHEEYFHDPDAPSANSMAPPAFAAVRKHNRRAGDR